MSSNLPKLTTESKQFFDSTFQNQVSFPVNQIDAITGFFEKRGFDVESARSTTIVILNQARADNVNVFEVIDTLNTLDDSELNQIVIQILNASREKTSLLGYRISSIVDAYESRNIVI